MTYLQLLDKLMKQPFAIVKRTQVVAEINGEVIPLKLKISNGKIIFIRSDGE